MRKSFQHTAIAALAAILVAGQAMTAFAAQDDSNYGPAFANKTPTVEQEGPGGPGAAAEALQPADTSVGNVQVSGEGTADGGTAQTAEGVDVLQEIVDNGGQAEGTQVPANLAYLQFQLLCPDLTWTDPIVDDTTVYPGEGGFLSMSIYANNLPGDVLYRTYASSRGWSNWAMNGGHTEWLIDAPVEAVQIRLNGVFGNQFDIYYTTTLSDGTQLSWSRNGGTNGTMATGKIVTGLRLSMWGKNVAGASYDLSRPVDAAAPDGIQFVNGVPVYSNGTGEGFTGWAWNDRDRYYFINNAAAVGWHYIDGYKYFFEADGRLVTDLEPYLASPGPFLIKINKQMNCTTVYIQDGENGFIVPYKTFLCSTGDDTPLGNHKTPEKYRWRLMVTDEYCQYLTRLGAGLPILLHSVIYERQDPYTLFPHTYNYLGANKSHGCIRYTTADAKWIYDNCALGTTVNVYESPIPGPFDRPALQVMIPDTQNWDPTDPNLPENQPQ